MSVCVANATIASLVWAYLVFFLFLIHRSEVVRCLSEIVRNDTLLEEDHRLSRGCRKQLRVELLARVTAIIQMAQCKAIVTPVH